MVSDFDCSSIPNKAKYVIISDCLAPTIPSITSTDSQTTTGGISEESTSRPTTVFYPTSAITSTLGREKTTESSTVNLETRTFPSEGSNSPSLPTFQPSQTNTEISDTTPFSPIHSLSTSPESNITDPGIEFTSPTSPLFDKGSTTERNDSFRCLNMGLLVSTIVLGIILVVILGALITVRIFKSSRDVPTLKFV